MSASEAERPPLTRPCTTTTTRQEFVVYAHEVLSARPDGAQDHAHVQWRGVAGVYPFEVAETKAHQVVQFARENEMPLQASLRKSQEEG
jgi:ATP-dependent Clp protease adaptor protein ClpS